MDFTNAKDLLNVCEENQLRISDVMIQREMELMGTTEDEIRARMMKSYQIMKESAKAATKAPIKTVGGIIGGEADRLQKQQDAGNGMLGSLVDNAIKYAMGVLEVNASMGLIVAAPTAGSAGVIPGVSLAFQEEFGVSDEDMVQALFTAGAIGYLAMRNATVAGAVGGCQAEIGFASAMAAAEITELRGGTPAQCEEAASMVLMNMLGLVCDPVAGLVEYPCQNRNAAGAAQALVAAEVTMSGTTQLIPLDQMIETVYKVGKGLPAALRETAMGGCAATPAGQHCTHCIFG